MTPSQKLQAFLDSEGVVLLDGGLATALENKGVTLHPSLWSAYSIYESPEKITEVHLDYLQAGAQIITTSSYQAVGLGEKSNELLRTSLKLAVEAKQQFLASATQSSPPEIFIAASVSPYGAILGDGSEYSGNYLSLLDNNFLIDFHRSRLEALLQDPGTDLILIETQPSGAEACLILDTLRSIRSDIPVFVSFSCRDSSHTCCGDEISEAVARVDSYEQVLAIGVNCCSPHFVASLLEIARTKTAKPLIAYPNSGEGWDPDTQTWITTSPEEITNNFQNFIKLWLEKGAKIIGGCCRTTPETILAIKKTIESLESTSPSDL